MEKKSFKFSPVNILLLILLATIIGSIIFLTVED